MIELTTRLEFELWNHYTKLLKEHSSRKIRNKYFQERKMDDWGDEYKQLENERREKVIELHEEVILQKKNEKQTIESKKGESPRRRSNRLNKDVMDACSGLLLLRHSV